MQTYSSEQWHYSQTDRSRHLPGRQGPTNKTSLLVDICSTWPYKFSQLHSNRSYLAQGEVLEEFRSTVRLSEGEGRGVAGNFDASATVLGSNLGLEGPPVLWVRVQSLE